MLCRGLRPGLSLDTPTAVSFLDLLRDVTIVRTLIGGCRLEGPGGGDTDDRVKINSFTRMCRDVLK